MTITFYGGIREIGGNKVLLEDGGNTILLDFGLPMGRSGRYFDEFVRPRTQQHLRDNLKLGLVPELEGLYREDLLGTDECWQAAQEMGVPAQARGLYQSDLLSYAKYLELHGKPRVDAVLLSHAHLDHFGQMGYLDSWIPLYTTDVTRVILQAVADIGVETVDAEALEVKLRALGEIGETGTFPGSFKIDSTVKLRRETHALTPGRIKDVAGFEVEAVAVDHSLPGCCAFYITCPSGKTVFYSGDLRFHGRWSLGAGNLTEMLRVRTRGLSPDVLLCEGTRITESAGDNERNVEQTITELVRGCAGLVMVDWGWKDTARFETLLAVAKATNRTLLISPKLAYLWNLLHQSDPAAYPTLDELGNVRVYLERSHSTLYSPSDYVAQKYKMGYVGEWDEAAKQQLKDAWLSQRLESVGDLATHYVGALRAYDVARDPAKYILQGGFFDIQELCDLDAPAGSLFIRAATEPFCEEMRIDEKKLQNWLTHFGFNAAEEALPRAHVSGHANGEDLLNWVREMEPRRVIPMHTEHPEVFEEELPYEVRQAEYGVGIEF